jgi:hypothetical protein
VPFGGKIDLRLGKLLLSGGLQFKKIFGLDAFLRTGYFFAFFDAFSSFLRHYAPFYDTRAMKIFPLKKI